MVPFLATGAIIGFVLGAILGIVGPDSPMASQGQEILAMAIPLGLIGGLLGGAAYLLAERLSTRR